MALVIDFLNEYYIDTYYYLADYYKKLVDRDIISLRDIDKLPGSELISYLDVERLIEDEGLFDFSKINTFN